MKAKIERTSDWTKSSEYREFNTLEELLSFKDRVGSSIIISAPCGYPDEETRDFDIEIYDDYRE